MKPRPHGNSKVNRPYARSMKSLQEKLKKSGGKASPKEALTQTLEKSGGLVMARCAGSISNNRSQVRYHQSLNSKKFKNGKSDSLLSVMLQCKSDSPDSNDAFVRSVVAAPEPMAVLCTNLCIPLSTIQSFLKNIFGKTIDDVHEAGLVDAVSQEDFECKLKALHMVWNERELAACPSRFPSFFEWFCKEKANIIKECMLSPVREKAGLGSPPSPFCTNMCECLNSVIHEKVHYKASEWHKFNESVRDLVKQSYQIAELSLIDHGDFRFRSQYQHLIVSQERWFHMIPKQRQYHLKRVAETLPLRCLELESLSAGFSAVVSSELNESESQILQGQSITFEVSAKDSDIQSLPIALLEEIWDKARYLLKKPGLVMDAPSVDSSSEHCYIVASKSAQRPHFVQRSRTGQFSCEASCPMWQSSKICSHCVAAAQFCNQLKKLILWYRKSKSHPNLDRLSKVGMPKGSGRKGEKPPRKSKKTKSAPLTVVGQDIPCSSTSLESETDMQPQSRSDDVQWKVDTFPQFVSTQTTIPPSSWSGTSPHNMWWYPPETSFHSYSSPYPPYHYSQHVSYSAAPRYRMPSPSPSSPASPSRPPIPVSGNSFFVRFISGNIRICQGCRGSLRTSSTSNGSISCTA